MAVRGPTRQQGRLGHSATAIFDPAGVPGLAYWYTLWPLHSYVFGGMLQQIAVTAVGSGG